MRVGAVLIKEVPYKRAGVSVTRDEYRVEATWKEGRARKKKWLMNWRAAEEFAAEQNKRLEATKGRVAFTFDDAAEAWLKQQELRVRAGDLGERSLLSYRHHLAHALKRFSKMLLRDIESHYIRAWLLEGAQQFRFTTLNDHKGAVFAVLKHAVEHKMLDVNPLIVTPVRIPGHHESSRDAPDPSDMAALARYLRGPRPYKVPRLTWSSMRVAIALGSIGLRCGEVCGLRWDRIDPDTGDITIREVIVGHPNPHVKAMPKTPAGRRTIPTHPSVRQVLNEHAMVWKELRGKCVGFVVRNLSFPSGREFMIPSDLSAKFANILKAAGIVDENDKPKYVFHQLRHWAASDFIRHLDIHRTKTLIGHKHASTTLDVYGHMIDGPDGRRKIEQMPSWLDEPMELDGQGRLMLPTPAHQNGELPELAAQPETPIEIPDWAEKWVATFVRELWAHGNLARALRAVAKSRSQMSYELRRIGLPTVAELEAIALTMLGAAEPQGDASEVLAPAPTRQECPIDLPEIGAGWLAPFVRLIDEGLSEEAACQWIRKAPKTVRAELRRLKVAKSVSELQRRLRNKKIMALHGQGYQDVEIAKLVGCHQDTVANLRRELRKPNASKPLKNNAFSPVFAKLDTRPEHKSQLKLL
jgi:integrase